MALEEEEKEEKVLMDQENIRMTKELMDLWHAWDSGRGESMTHDPPWARDTGSCINERPVFKLRSLMKGRQKNS